MSQAVATVLLLVVFPFLMAYAAASDLFTMTIPNRIAVGLTGAFFAFALALRLPLDVVGFHTLAGVAMLVVTFVLFACGWFGGGDAKLAAATALWLGIEGLSDYLVLASIGGGALTLAILVARGQVLPRFAQGWVWAQRLHDQKTGIPYGIALAAAALVALPGSALWATALSLTGAPLP